MLLKKEELYATNKIIISELNGGLYFEIGQETTDDIAEAVSILMSKQIDEDDPIWKKEIKNLDIVIAPEKSLFWLSGGYKEWNSLANYNSPWGECFLDFQEEFGLSVLNCVRGSKNLKEIRDFFIKYLNLATMYDFALSRNLVY